MKQYKVVYYNIVDTLDYERSLLDQWKIRNLGLVEVHDKSGKRSFADYASDADGAVVEYETVSRDVLKKLKQCKIIALQSIGYNNIDLAAATDRGICVTNAPGFCTEEVALHTIGLIIDLVRNISYFDRSVRAGKWSYESAPKMHRIAGKTIGLVFFGSIPKAMMPMLKAMQLRVLVYAPTKSKEYLEKFGAEKADTLNRLLHESDVVSLHAPLKKETFHMMGETQLKEMKKSAFLINTARGSIVDEKALIHALKAGTIAGAGVDVIEDEVHHCSDLSKLGNVVITPHTAFLSEDSFYGARKIALRQLVERLVEQRSPDHLVNRELAVQV